MACQLYESAIRDEGGRNQKSHTLSAYYLLDVVDPMFTLPSELTPGQLFKFPKARYDSTVRGGFSPEIGSSASFCDDRPSLVTVPLWATEI